MVPEAGKRWRKRSVLLVVVVLLVGGVGVATAAVSGDFSSSYDGYNDGSDTDVRGHEIQVSGTIEFTGDSAVQPRIIVQASQHTVLDDGSVTLLQPGDTSINFQKDQVNGGVRYGADEIPSGTRLNLEFVVYPVSGLTQSEIQSAQVVVAYDLPSGQSERQTIDVTTALSNTPPEEISSGQTESGGLVDLATKILAVIGVISILVGAFLILRDGGGPPTP